jgi:pimeloyl-ACP methyl ester carboxylesterase
VQTTPFRVRVPGGELAGVRFGEGPPLILVHPMLFSKAYYAAAAHVYGARYSCAAFDQRGHGESVATAISLGVLVDDVGAVMDACGWERATLGGTSLGAAATLGFAVRNPQRVSALVQDLPGFGPGGFRPADRAARIAAALDDGDLEEGARRIVEGMSPPRAEAWTAALAADWRHYDAAPLARRMGWALRSSSPWRVVDGWPRSLAAVKAPTRILAVQGDPLHPWTTAREMAAAIPGARLIPRVPSLAPEAIAAQWMEALAS